MKRSQAISGFLLVVVAAAFGYMLIVLPPKIIDQYASLAQKGAIWANLYLGLVIAGGAILGGATLWIVWRLWGASRRKRLQRERSGKNPSQLSLAERQQEIDDNLESAANLRSDPAVPAELRRELDPLVERVDEKRRQQSLEIVAFGTVSSGKSSLLNALAGREVFRTDAKGGTTTRRNEIPWPGADKVTLVDTPGLGEIDGAARVGISAEAAKDADLVLVVVDGPLRDSEFRLLDQLGEMEKRILICLNKEDWYDEHERSGLLKQIAGQVKDFVRPDDVVAVQAQPTHRSRVRVLADGSETQESVEVPADIAPLARRMMQVIQQDGRDLLLANLLLQSRGLVDEAKNRVKEALDRRAWEIVQRYMWGAGSAAAISPFPLVDLAAGAAISSKMVLELARVYHQDVDINVAVNLLGQLGKNLISILGASAAAPAVGAFVASLLKTVPGIGTIAGGMLQGVVQAVVTRWIGAVFIHYFRNEMREPIGSLASMARKEWERITSVGELRKLVQTARHEISDDDPS